MLYVFQMVEDASGDFTWKVEKKAKEAVKLKTV